MTVHHNADLRPACGADGPSIISGIDKFVTCERCRAIMEGEEGSRTYGGENERNTKDDGY